MLALPLPTHLHAQDVTSQAPPAKAVENPLPDAPQYPAAHALLPPASPDSPVIESATQSYRAGVYTLDGAVVITDGNRRIEADHIEYDSNTSEVTATGHLVLTGGPNSEVLRADSGTFNIRTSTGRFTNVSGSVGLKPAKTSSGRAVYTTANPFLFTGRIVVKTGPQSYDVYDGSVTSCQLAHPDWLLTSAHFSIDGEKARARNSTFRLLNMPLLFLPYVTAPTDSEQRQSGFLIPTIGQSSTKGLVLGEEFYIAINRSMDLTVGAEYFSSIGFAQNATFRYRGAGLDFVNVHYTGVLDRRSGTANQGGEDFILAARHDFGPHTRTAANVDYLSSYIFREAFTDTFNQAVTSDIISTAYISRAANGIETSALADRYQGIKTIAQGATPLNPAGIQQQQVRIFHAPTLAFATTDHRVAGTGLQVAMEASASGLKRSQPNFVTGGIIERFDFHPQVSYPLAFGSWHMVPSIAARETVYTRSRRQPVRGQPPLEDPAALSRSDFEFAFAVRTPVLTRTFAPTHLTRLLGNELRHTIEPELTYRLTTGISNFSSILRFDATDIASNTNEAEYGITQRIFRRIRHSGPCQTATVAAEPGFNSTPDDTSDPAAISPRQVASQPAAPEICTHSEALISWRLTQKYFFDPTFGAAIINRRRNIFESTLDLSGVAFLTERRDISPLISRLRVRTSPHTDVEWDFDLDTGARKFTSSNVFIDIHQGQAFSAVSYARLDAPGRFFTQNPDPPVGTTSATGVSSSVSDFNQLRFLLGYGNPGKPGLSLASNIGLDLKSFYGTTSNNSSAAGSTSTTVYPALLQYAAVQGSYNFNCCGFSVEYRKFELGSVRNEGTYKFSFTLANIGTAGNLRRAERLF
jgi:LPS-assembly protein